MLSERASRLWIWVTVQLGHLPLPWLRTLGAGVGVLLFVAIWPRRHVTTTNLRVCFPQLDARQIRRLALRNFIRVSQSWFDRGWLWQGSPELVRERLQLSGAVQELEGSDPVVIFAPHFVGLDAGWTALTQQVARRFTGIYARQSNAILDAWILAGRVRFGQTLPFFRGVGVKTIVGALRDTHPLYLLPDMDFGAQESVFVPFYGVSTATVSSLSRFARLGRAKVVPLVTRMTPKGYEVQVMPAWRDFPTSDALADTALMNQRLQGYIDTMPEQYYWVHKRFKSRPPGERSVY